MNEEQFLKVSSPLGVDRVRHGDASDGVTVYVYLGFEHKGSREDIVRLAKEVWPQRRIMVIYTVPTTPPAR